MLENVLKIHSEKYKKLQPADAVKLVYQNEFGGGHLILDREASLSYIKMELERTPTNEALPLYEDIGNGIVRVNLAKISEYRISPEELNDVFVLSAENVFGTIPSFENKLSLLVSLAEADTFSFSANELYEYLKEYQKRGYPPVSHSEIYRREYAPAYRIVIKKYLDKLL